MSCHVLASTVEILWLNDSIIVKIKYKIKVVSSSLHEIERLIFVLGRNLTNPAWIIKYRDANVVGVEVCLESVTLVFPTRLLLIMANNSSIRSYSSFTRTWASNIEWA